jgi:hypothetical protein
LGLDDDVLEDDDLEEDDGLEDDDDFPVRLIIDAFFCHLLLRETTTVGVGLDVRGGGRAVDFDLRDVFVLSLEDFVMVPSPIPPAIPPQFFLRAGVHVSRRDNNS